MTEPADDPCIDPTTGVLRNLVGATTKVALEEIDGDLTFARLVQLVEHPVATTGDLDELRATRRHLFQDVYPWAGELPTIDMRKDTWGDSRERIATFDRHWSSWSAILGAGTYMQEGVLRFADAYVCAVGDLAAHGGEA